LRSAIARFLEGVWYRGARFGFLLVPLSWIYSLLLSLRRRRARAHRQALPVPVIVVGNVTVGGTGKTPVVIWLVEQLCARGYSPGIVTRGYLGSATSEPLRVAADTSPQRAGDEAVLLAQRLQCPVTACTDRVAGVRHLLADAAIDVVVSDDGLQHFELQADCVIVVVDGHRGLGNARLLPAGPLRESARRLDSAELVLVNGDGWSRARATRFDLQATIVRQLSDGAQRTLDDFHGRSVHAVAAIGNPERFFAMLRRAGCSVDAHAAADHAVIPVEALQFADDAPVLITEKDAVKCGSGVPAGIWSVAVEVRFPPTVAAQVMEKVTQRIADVPAQR